MIKSIKSTLCAFFLSVFAVNSSRPESQFPSKIKDKNIQRIKKELREKGFSDKQKIYLRIFKSEKKLELWKQNGSLYTLYKVFPICHFSGTLGPKEKIADKQAPEGVYQVQKSNLNPNSNFHLSFNVGYPNAFDRFHKHSGSAIMVHGACVSIGCFAMGDTAAEELFVLLTMVFNEGQDTVPLHIFPFQMSDKNLSQHSNNKWHSFWTELKPIYESFEKHRYPPTVSVKDGRYQLQNSQNIKSFQGEKSKWMMEKALSTFENNSSVGMDSDKCQKILRRGRQMSKEKIYYNAKYFGMKFPNGDAPQDAGVCSDMIIRALRALNYDLQSEIFYDQQAHPYAYPKLWGHSKLDANIDHRRVPMIMSFLERSHVPLQITQNVESFKPCDIVTWDLGNGLTHIGWVSDEKNFRGVPKIIHHISTVPKEEDFLFDYKIIGHYRLSIP